MVVLQHGGHSGFTTVRDGRRLRTAGNLSGLWESLGEFAAQRHDRRQRLGSEAPWLVLGPVAFLSTLGGMNLREATRAADGARQVIVGVAADRIVTPGATKTQPPAPAVIYARLGAGI